MRPHLPEPFFFPRIYWRAILLLACSVLFLKAHDLLRNRGLFLTVVDNAIYRWVYVLIGLGISIFAIYLVWTGANRISRCGGIVCPWCNYDLRASPPEGNCPECGKPYTHEHLKNYWFTSPIARWWRRRKGA